MPKLVSATSLSSFPLCTRQADCTAARPPRRAHTVLGEPERYGPIERKPGGVTLVSTLCTSCSIGQCQLTLQVLREPDRGAWDPGWSDERRGVERSGDAGAVVGGGRARRWSPPLIQPPFEARGSGASSTGTTNFAVPNRTEAPPAPRRPSTLRTPAPTVGGAAMRWRRGRVRPVRSGQEHAVSGLLRRLRSCVDVRLLHRQRRE